VPVYQQENSAARRPIWIARIKGDLVPLIADMAQRRQLPDASNLRKLNGRSWKFVIEMDLNLELKVPLYEVIAPDVGRLMKQNLMNKQIAYELNVSEATIKAHVTAILRKLRVTNRTQAVLAMQKLTIDDQSL